MVLEFGVNTKATHRRTATNAVPFWVKKQREQAAWRTELRRRGHTFEIGRESCNLERSKSSCLREGRWTQYSRTPATARACGLGAPGVNATGDVKDWSGWRAPPLLVERLSAPWPGTTGA